jgi:hypothetical protein
MSATPIRVLRRGLLRPAVAEAVAKAATAAEAVAEAVAKAARAAIAAAARAEAVARAARAAKAAVVKAEDSLLIKENFAETQVPRPTPKTERRPVSSTGLQGGTTNPDVVSRASLHRNGLFRSS